jgi:hypothetical protein
MNPRRVRLMDGCWPILSKTFTEALKTAATGKGQGAYDGTWPGRLVMTLTAVSAKSSVLGPLDRDVNAGHRNYEHTVDDIVSLCRDQNNPRPIIAELLAPLIESENKTLLHALYGSASLLTPSPSSTKELLQEMAQRITSYPLVLLVAADHHGLSDEETDDLYIRTRVPLRDRDRALVYSSAQHLVSYQIIEPLTLDWDLGNADKVTLIASTRAILRRQTDHQVFRWA